MDGLLKETPCRYPFAALPFRSDFRYPVLKGPSRLSMSSTSTNMVMLGSHILVGAKPRLVIKFHCLTSFWRISAIHRLRQSSFITTRVNELAFLNSWRSTTCT